MCKTRLHSLAILVIASLLLARCGTLPSAESMQDAPTQTTTSSQDTRRWQAKPVLVKFRHGPVLEGWSQIPRLLVYADGRVITARYDDTKEPVTLTMEESQLSPAELCALLGEIESYSFFDFDPEDYTPPLMFDGIATDIEVNAWRSRSITAYQLEAVLRGELDGEVPAPIADTYELLKGYTPAEQRPYQAQRVVVFVTKSTVGSAAPDWPSTTLSLGELNTRYDVSIEGEVAAELQALFGAERTKRYVEGETSYQVTLHRLLPLEIWQSGPVLQRTIEFEDAPTRELVC